MRRFDKKKQMIKANLLLEQRYLESKLTEGLVSEIEISDYKLDTRDATNIRASFVVGDLKYTAHIWHKGDKHSFGMYEVSFEAVGQKHEAERQGKDIKHLNNVLYTVMEIVEEVVKKYKIKTIKIDGASDEKDASGIFADTLRGRLYTRFLRNRYPDEAIDAIGRHIKIDMTKVFPDEISNERTPIDNLLDVMLKISDGDPDLEYLKRGLDGSNESDVSFNSDLTNNKLGTINISVNLNHGYGYYVEWEIYDTGKTGDVDGFKNLEGVIKYLEDTFLSSQVEPEPQVDEAGEISKLLNSIGEITYSHNDNKGWRFTTLINGIEITVDNFGNKYSFDSLPKVNKNDFARKEDLIKFFDDNNVSKEFGTFEELVNYVQSNVGSQQAVNQ